MTVKGYRAASPYVVAVLSLAYLLAIVDRMVLSLLIDPIKADLHVTDTEIGLLAGLAFGLFYTVLGIPLGRLADRMHRPLLISSGLILWSLATMACGLTANFAQLLMARFSVGVGEATISPASYSLIADYVPKSKLGRALSVYMLRTPIGLGLAWILGGQVIHWLNALGPLDFRLIRTLAPWQTVFMAAGLPGLLVAPFVMLITEPRKHGGRTSCDPVPLDRGSHEPAPPSTAFDFASVWNQLRSAKAVYLSHFLGIGAVEYLRICPGHLGPRDVSPRVRLVDRAHWPSPRVWHHVDGHRRHARQWPCHRLSHPQGRGRMRLSGCCF